MSPKDFSASFWEEIRLCFKSLSEPTTLIPFPPPPADALINMGNPISDAILAPCFSSEISPRNPGTIDTPASSAIFFDDILSPIESIAELGGPIKMKLFFSTSLAKSEFSERNPYPG